MGRKILRFVCVGVSFCEGDVDDISRTTGPSPQRAKSSNLLLATTNSSRLNSGCRFACLVK